MFPRVPRSPTEAPTLSAGIEPVQSPAGLAVGRPGLWQVFTGHVIDQLPVGELRIRLDDQPTEEWFETWRVVHGAGGDPGPEWDMLRRVGLPSGYASVVTAAGVVAVGRAVADTGWAGVFGMATLPDVRGRGAGREVLAALARWAAEHAADRMYLQVEEDNPAARRLYEGAGFTELCRYHYRSNVRAQVTGPTRGGDVGRRLRP